MPYSPTAYRRKPGLDDDDMYAPATLPNGLPDLGSTLPDDSDSQTEDFQASAPAAPKPDATPKPPDTERTGPAAQLANAQPPEPDPKAPWKAAKAFQPPPPPPAPEPSAPPAVNTPIAPKATPQIPGQEPARPRSYGQQKMDELGAPPSPTSQPKWWQKLLGGIVAARVNAPAGPNAALREEILHPGYQGQLNEYNRKKQYAQDVLDQEHAQRGQDIQEEQLASLRQNRAAVQQQQAENEEDRRTQNEALNKQRALDGSRRAFQALKGRQTPTYHDPNEPVPPGYAALDDPDVPGKKAWVRAGMRPVPKELVDYLPGFKQGDQAPLEDLDAAAKAYRDDQKAQNKPINWNNATLAIKAAGGDPSNPDSVTQGIAGKASNILKPPKEATGGGLNLSADALDMAALSYLRTGTLPSFGMGKDAGAAKAKVLNRAAQMQPGGDVQVNKADYKSMSDSLVKLQTQKNAIGAFERAAGKNLDVFLQQSQGLVDAKSPILNRVFRGGQRELTGGLEGFDAARVTAFTEVSRVLSGSMGAQLSDSARHEAENIIKGDYTVDGLRRAVAVLRQDMKNRMQSYNEQIAEVQAALRKSRPGKNAGGPPEPDAPSRKIPVSAGGKTYYFDTQAQADQFKRDAGVR